MPCNVLWWFKCCHLVSHIAQLSHAIGQCWDNWSQILTYLSCFNLFWTDSRFTHGTRGICIVKAMYGVNKLGLLLFLCFSSRKLKQSTTSTQIIHIKPLITDTQTHSSNWLWPFLVQTGELWQTNKQKHTHTHPEGRYQAHCLPALRSIIMQDVTKIQKWEPQ